MTAKEEKPNVNSVEPEPNTANPRDVLLSSVPTGGNDTIIIDRSKILRCQWQ